MVYDLCPALRQATADAVCPTRSTSTAGELRHLYTPVFGGLVFFEVVQRPSGYDGFDEVNFAVNMSAHHHLRLTATGPG